jgi:hypothetical protein
VECRVYTPGRQLEYRAKAVEDDAGKPSCPLPTFTDAHAAFTCSSEVKFLEIEVVLDSYHIVATAAPRFGCRKDTIVNAPSAPFQVLY